jgi:hypothetical protein
MSIQQSVLLQAAGVAGGVQALARRLRVPSKQLTSWMEGEAQTPHTVYLRVLDFVAARS